MCYTENTPHGDMNILLNVDICPMKITYSPILPSLVYAGQEPKSVSHTQGWHLNQQPTTKLEGPIHLSKLFRNATSPTKHKQVHPNYMKDKIVLALHQYSTMSANLW